MNYLVILCSLLLCSARGHDVFRRSIFPWSHSEESKEVDTPVPGYKPILQVHKYNGIQINPINGGQPIYLESPAAISAQGISGSAVPEEQLQQIDLLTRVAPFLPEENQLHELDFTSFLPYVDLISENSLDRLRFTLEAASTKSKEKSKLLKFLGYLKFLKEKKLQPFRIAANAGSKLIHKKKETVHNAFSFLYPTTTPVPVIVPTDPFNPFLVPGLPQADPVQQASPAQQGNPVQQADSVQQADPMQQAGQASVQPARPEAYYQQFLFNQISPPHPIPLFQPGYPLHHLQTYTAAPPQNNANIDWSKFSQNHFSGFNPALASPPVQQHHLTNVNFAPPSAPLNSNFFREESTPSSTPSSQNYDSQRFSGQQSWTNFEHSHVKEENGRQRYQTPAHTYLNTDLLSSASENVQKLSESNVNSVPTNAEPEKMRVEEAKPLKPVEVSNDFVKPKLARTILRPVATRPPVLVYPEPNADVKAKGN